MNARVIPLDHFRDVQTPDVAVREMLAYWQGNVPDALVDARLTEMHCAISRRWIWRQVIEALTELQEVM